MRIRLRYLLIVMFLTLPLQATPNLRVIVQPEEQLTRRIMIVMDNSGSMSGQKFGHALDAITAIMSQPTDEMEIALIAFNTAPSRWPGIPEDDLQPEWARLPSADAVKLIEAWLRRCGVGGNTRVCTAIALALAEPVDEMSIILITDGRFQDAASAHGVLLAGQQERINNDMAPVVFAVYGIGIERDVLTRLAEAGRGGYFLETMAPTATPPVTPNWR